MTGQTRQPNRSDQSDQSAIPAFTREDFDAYQSTVRDIARCYLELGELASTEKEGRAMGHFQSQESSVAARDRQADFQVLNITTDIIRLKNKIAALEAQRDFYASWLAAVRLPAI